MKRCTWAGTDPLMTAYHDHEWGVPIHNDQDLFEFLILEGAQAGLSWSTILKKREAYRTAFDGFDAAKIALYDEAKIADLLANPGIVRNRLKVRAAVRNAQAFLSIQRKHSTFDSYMWQFVGGEPVRNRWAHMADLPARSPESNAMSKSLLQHGFTFVGSTICYSFMQATGMVNDHLTSCFRYAEI